MSLTQKIAHNTIIQFIGKALSTVLGVFTIAIMARYLGKVGFGQYSTVMAYLQIFGILFDLGLQITIVRMIADPKYDKKSIVNNILTLRLVSAIFFLGLAPLIVLFFPYDNIVKIGIAITTFSFLVTALNSVLIGIFQNEMKMAKIAISEVVGRIILLILVIVFAFLDKGLVFILMAVVIGNTVNFILSYIFALKFVKIRLSFNWRVWKQILLVTWPIAISIALNLIYFKADTLILSLVRSQAEVGIYSAPYRVLEILSAFIYMFMGLVFPILTYHWAKKNYVEFKKLFQKCWDFLIILGVPMVFGTFFLAKDIMLLIAGPEFAESGLVLQIIIFATFIIFINAPLGFAVVALDKQVKMVPAYIFVAIVSLVGYLILIPRYGYIGAAGFTIVAEALVFTFNFIVTTRTAKFIPSFRIFFKTIAASIIMSLFILYFASLNLIILICLSAVVYLLALYLFRGFSKEFVLEIINIRNKY